MRRGTYNDPTDPLTIENHISNEYNFEVTVESADNLDIDVSHLALDESYTIRSDNSKEQLDVAIDLYSDLSQAIFSYGDNKGKVITGVYRQNVPEVVGQEAVEYFTSDL